MVRARPLAPDDRRALLVQAAHEVFAARGYHRASVSDILEVAGVARGTFYNYFESKREIFSAVLQDVIDAVGRAVHPIDVHAPIAPQVKENLRRMVQALVDEGEGMRILFTDALGVDDEARVAIAQFYAAAVARIERALQTGQRMTVVREGDVHLTAQCLLGALKEPVLQGLLTGTPPDPEALAEEIWLLLTESIFRTR